MKLYIAFLVIMKIVKTPKLAKKVLRKISWRINHQDKCIFITFDDGPTPEITDWVIETLDKYGAKATFFCTGRNVEKHPEIYRKIIAAGHQTGNHTYSHLNGWKTKKEEYINDVNLAKQQIISSLFRPPYGKIKPSQYKSLINDFEIILWDVLSWDFNKKTSKDRCLTNVLTKTEKGSIVVFHDTQTAKENLYYVLPIFLEKFTKKGYCFKTIK
jgi:peptidoglycan-N-acetylglucosamine deacetylase